MLTIDPKRNSRVNFRVYHHHNLSHHDVNTRHVRDGFKLCTTSRVKTKDIDETDRITLGILKCHVL